MAQGPLKKQQMEYIAISTLVIVALLVGITRFKKKEKDDEVFSRKEFNKKWEEVEILEATLPQEEKGIGYAVAVTRAPLESPFEAGKTEMVASDIALPAMTFQGMVWSSTRPQAIVDNKVYDIGDTIETSTGEAAVKVKGIQRDGIHLRYRGKEFIVRPK